MRFRHLVVLAVLLWGAGIPVSAQATVLISEVAWMGGVSSPNHEWIEIHNSGSAAIDVSGWTLSDGANLLITLSGMVAPGAYVVLERTSDESAPGTALLIYTGALVNTGATLTLRRADGQIEDQVAGGADWEAIGGDNATKATAQFRSGQGWLTATPTPGRETMVAVVTVPDTDNTEDSDPSPTGGTAERDLPSVRTGRGGASPIVPSTATLALAIVAPTVVHVGESVSFLAEARGIGRTIIDSLSYRWNFGDLTMASGSSVTHRYDHPGIYTAALRAGYARHNEVVYHEISVIAPVLDIRVEEAGVVEIENRGEQAIDVSGYRLQADGQTVVFPPDSIIRAGGTITIKATNAGPIALYDGRAHQLAVAASRTAVSTSTPEPARHRASMRAASAPTVVPEAIVNQEKQSMSSSLLKASTALGLMAGTVTTTPYATSRPTAQIGVVKHWPYVALVLIILLGVAGLFLKRPHISGGQSPSPRLFDDR